MEHRFNVRLARDYGIEEAILIDNLYYWIAKNVANEIHKHEGRYWTYNSAKAFAELFPYINETKIYRVLSHLEEVGIITKGKFSQDKHDRTNWYSFTDMGIVLLQQEKYDTSNFSDTFQNDEMHFANLQNGTCKNAKSILINNTNSKLQIVNKKEDTNVSPKKEALDYEKIVDCWNEYNGKRCGKVTRLTDKRKRAIKKIVTEHELSQDELMRLFKTLPCADSWLYNPTREHKNWKPDFDWWMANTNGWFTKALEGKVHTQNAAAFNDIMQNGQGNIYTPSGNFSIMWDEQLNAYLYIGYYNDGMPIADGYTDGTRPDGARIVLNNGRGEIVWSAITRTWIKQ